MNEATAAQLVIARLLAEWHLLGITDGVPSYHEFAARIVGELGNHQPPILLTFADEWGVTT